MNGNLDSLNDLLNNAPGPNHGAQQSIRVEGDDDANPIQPSAPNPTQAGPPDAQNGTNSPALPQVSPTPQSPQQTQGMSNQQGQQGGQKKGPQSPTIPANQQTSRAGVSTLSQNAPVATTTQSGQSISLKDSSDPNAYYDNLVTLADKSLQMAQHDRSLAIATLQVHLDRGEVLDSLPLSMPVSSVISDNTGACLKSLELVQRAGDRMFKVAELLVNAKKADDTALINAYKAEIAANKNKPDSEWGGEDDLPT